jgi:glycosyltransferase involved in cell wall biosynthesis
MADQIIVASSFTAKSLSDYSGKLAPISVIPYGFPSVVENRVYKKLKHRPLKLLFVGGLSQRKGIANLFEAVSYLGDKVSLTVVGRKSVEGCKPLNEALNLHSWIPSLPHAEILQLMREHDVLVFPSLFEGFGLVITEAMSQGTPVITTDRTAGPDIIKHNVNGWLIEAGSTNALKECIENILHNPVMLKEVGLAAIETARNRTWETYGNELAATIRGREGVNQSKLK